MVFPVGGTPQKLELPLGSGERQFVPAKERALARDDDDDGAAVEGDVV
jgi:hypothetical protein